jgi:MFS family permease
LLLLDGTGGWAGWRWLFLVEGIPSVATGVAMLYVLPKDFAAAKFLGAQDKAWLTQV